jgi:hypothetical protein
LVKEHLYFSYPQRKKQSLEKLYANVISELGEKIKILYILPDSERDTPFDKISFFYRYICGLALTKPITDIKDKILILFQDLKIGSPQPKPFEEAYTRQFRLKPEDAKRIAGFEEKSLSKFKVCFSNKFLLLEALNFENAVAQNKICEITNYLKTGAYEFDQMNLCFIGEALLDLIVTNWTAFTVNPECEREYTKRELDILKAYYHDVVEYQLVDVLDFLTYLNTNMHQSEYKQKRQELGKGIYALLAAIYMDHCNLQDLERFLTESVKFDNVLERFSHVKLSHEEECCFGSYICTYRVDGHVVGAGEGASEFESELDAKCKTFKCLSLIKANGFDVAWKFEEKWLINVPRSLLTTKTLDEMEKNANLAKIIFYSSSVKKNHQKEIELFNSCKKIFNSRSNPKSNE